MHDFRQRTATHAPTRKSDIYLKLGARPLAPLYRRIDKLLAAGEPFVTVHALGKAVSQAKKLADGVLRRRVQDVTLDISTESVNVFDDVFPSGDNLETALPQSRKRSVPAIHIKITRTAVEKQISEIAKVFPAPPTPVEEKQSKSVDSKGSSSKDGKSTPSSDSASGTSGSANSSIADGLKSGGTTGNTFSGSSNQSYGKPSVSSLLHAYEHRGTAGGRSDTSGSHQSGSSNPFAVLQQSRFKPQGGHPRRQNNPSANVNATSSASGHVGTNPEPLRTLSKSQRRNLKKKEKRKRQQAEAREAASAGNVPLGGSHGSGCNPSSNKKPRTG